MNKVKSIWIESEAKGPVIEGIAELDDNSDVIVHFTNGDRYVATFFTFKNIESLRQRNKKTGDFLNGKYFYASDLLLVDKLNREEIKIIVNHLIIENEFFKVFTKIEE